MKIAIIGVGVTGKALSKYIRENTDHSVMEHDPPKGIHASIEFADIAFVCVPAPTFTTGGQDLKYMQDYLHMEIPTFIRTTLLPDVANDLSNMRDNFHIVPEFLTERRSYEDMCEQAIVCTEEAHKILRDVFPEDKEFILQKSNWDCSLVKYAHNCFGALKVNFFNNIFKMSNDYEKVRNGVLATGYINEEHTNVPGHDGRWGYGGNCFLKDMVAFAEATKIGSLQETVKENNINRQGHIKDSWYEG